MKSSALAREPQSIVSKASARRQLIIGLLISSITLALSLGGLEFAGYLWETKTAQGPLGWTLVASRRLKLERHGAADQPYYLFSPNEHYLWEGIPAHTNFYGFRTEEFAIPKPANTFRVLNLGDSIAFGWEVRQEDTYGKQSESLLNQRNDGRVYEVINAGIPTWNLEAEGNFLLQEGLEYQPDLVILDITIVNDIYGRGPTISEEQTIFQWLRDHTYGWPFLTTQARFLLAKQWGPEAIPVLNPPRNAQAYYPLQADSPVYHRFWDYIAEMYEVCQQRGVDFVVVVFPTAFQLNDANHPDVPQRVLRDEAERAGIKFIDLLPVYRQVCKEEGLEACAEYENLLFADVWMHPNQLGHQLAVKQILQALKSLPGHME